MEKVPIEIIELILSAPRLTLEDILNFSSTCSLLREVVLGSSYIWKKRYQLMWPQFMKLFPNDFTDWFKEIRYLYELQSRSHAVLSTMSQRFYKKTELSDCDLEEWAILIDESSRAYQYVVLDLMTVINTCTPIKSIEVVPMDTLGNKTMQYYALKVLRYIRQLELSKDWKAFVELPEKRQILEKGATFVAQWCQPVLDIKWESIAAQLDALANEVLICLRLKYPKHPLFKVPQKTLSMWRSENLSENQWNVQECRQIIQCLATVLYEHNTFHGNNIAYYMPENSFINAVLMKKRGLPITLAIVYESVARRLGLKCDPISFPAHFLLRFTEGKGEGSADSYYIDVFNNGDIIRKGACPHSRNFSESKDRNMQPATARQVVERMANNLEVSCRQYSTNGSITPLRSTLELLHLIKPNDITAVVSLARIYMLHNIDTKALANYLVSGEFESPEQIRRVVHMLRDFDEHHKHNFTEQILQPEPKNRPKNLLFAVGMVMQHLVLNYKCVIYDWDPICMASQEWQLQMGIQRLRDKEHQPFYNVLVEDGSHRYVAQENMVPTANISGFLDANEDIGRHFSHFFETHYVPNAEKEKEFPGDAQVRHTYYQKMQFGI